MSSTSTDITSFPEPSPTNTANTSSTDPSGLFSSNASPALIVAFLAIGIFAGVFIVMAFLRKYGVINCIWRERRMAFIAREAEVRGWAAGVADAQRDDRRSRKSRRPLGPKPKLWDVQTVPLLPSEDDFGKGWSVIEPLSLQCLSTLPPTTDEVENIELPSQLQFQGPISRTRDFIHRWLERKETTSVSKAKNAVVTHDSMAQLYVAVAISMPAPEKQKSEEAAIYELGIMTITWDMHKAELVIPSDENLISVVDGVPAYAR